MLLLDIAPTKQTSKQIPIMVYTLGKGLGRTEYNLLRESIFAANLSRAIHHAATLVCRYIYTKANGVLTRGSHDF